MKITINTFILLFFIAAQAQNDVSEYYFPKSKNKNPTTYQYVNIKDSKDRYFWRVTYDDVRDELITEGFNDELFKFNYFVEKYVHNGTILVKAIDYQKHYVVLTKSHVANIIKNDVYKWNSDFKYDYEINITGEYGNTTLNKSRKFIGFETIEIQGKSYDCAKFIEEYKNVFHDHNVTHEMYQITYYAHSLGMVKCVRYIDQDTIDYELSSILTDEEFDELKD